MGGNNEIPISADAPSVILELIYQLKIKDVMTTSVLTAKSTQTMRHIQQLMRENRISGIPIVDNKHVVGIVSIEDLITALDMGCIEETLEKRMTRDVICLQDDMPLSFAISYLNKYRHGRFPVLNKDKEIVGILSSIDVIRTLLVEINREMLQLEKIHKDAADKKNSLFSEMEFATTRYDFELAGRASTDIKKALKQRNFDPKVIRRIAIACYELEINQVVHSNGGVIRCSIQPDRVVIIAEDTGPGIADISKALQEGWSTATEYVRSLGFGAGMGLANTKRVSDEFSIESAPGSGTTVRSVVYVNSEKSDTE